MATGISSFFPTLPILFVLAMFVLLLPVPGFYRNRNMSVLFYVGWLYVGNGIYFLNMILWRRNIVNWAPVYCDIATFFITMLPMGISCSLLCINKLVWNISKSSTLSVRSTAQRNVIDTVICLGIPLVYGLFHIFVQAHRFTIIEDVGCVPSTDRALPSLLVYYLPPSVICCCITSLYCIASISNLFNNRYKTNSFLPTNVVSALTLNRFIRLIALCTTSFIFCGTFLLSMLVKNIQIGFTSFASWSEHTFDFSTIDTIRAQELDTLKHRRTLVLLQLLPIPVLSVHFFLFFGFGKEAVKHYQSSFNLVRFIMKRILSSSMIHWLFHRQRRGGQEEDVDRMTRRSIVSGFRIVSIPPPPAVAQPDSAKGRALRNVDTILLGIERSSPPASRPHTPTPSPRPSMLEVGRGSYILIGRASPFLTGTPPFSPAPSRASTPSPSERKIKEGFLQPPAAHSRRTSLQPLISPSRRTSTQSVISPISPLSNSDGMSVSVDVGHFPHPPPHFFDEVAPSPILELQLASFPDPPPPRGLRVINGPERVVDPSAEPSTSSQPQLQPGRSRRESARIAYPPPTMANTNAGATSRFMPRRLSNRFFGHANGSRTSFGFGHGFIRASGTGSLLRIDAEMANAIPSGYSHVGFTVPVPGPAQNVDVVQGTAQAQSEEAHVEEANFTIHEQEFDAVELGDVTRVQSTGGPFYGHIDGGEGGGANTASTRSRFSVYSEDPESPVHTRSRYTRLFSWHSQAARRSGKVNRSL